MPRNPYANEPMLVTTPDWRKDFGTWIDGKRGRRNSLAKELDVDPSLLSKLRSGDVRKSELIMPICRATGVNPPTGHVDPGFLDDLSMLRDKNPDAYEQLRRLAESFLNPKSASK